VLILANAASRLVIGGRHGADKGSSGGRVHGGSPSLLSGDVDDGSAVGVGFGPAEDFPGDGGDFADAEEQVAQ
jgi:hypothetical protein